MGSMAGRRYLTVDKAGTDSALQIVTASGTGFSITKHLAQSGKIGYRQAAL